MTIQEKADQEALKIMDQLERDLERLKEEAAKKPNVIMNTSSCCLMKR